MAISLIKPKLREKSAPTSLKGLLNLMTTWYSLVDSHPGQHYPAINSRPALAAVRRHDCSPVMLCCTTLHVFAQIAAEQSTDPASP